MPNANTPQLKDGDRCRVVAGLAPPKRPCLPQAGTRRRSTHKGKSGIARDLNISKTGHLTITVVQANGVRFRTLGRNVVVRTK